MPPENAEQLLKLHNNKQRKIAQVDLTTGQVVAIHDSLGDASRSVPKGRIGHIWTCCQNTGRKLHAGFAWQYEDEI